MVLMLAKRLAGTYIGIMPLPPKELRELTNDYFGGTLAQAAYDRMDVWNALILATNLKIRSRYLEKGKFDTNTDRIVAVGQLAVLEQWMAWQPTHTVKTEVMETYQQFSTPPTLAYLAAWVAAMKDTDTVLEPSAGVGSLAIHAINRGCKVILNELETARAELLSLAFPSIGVTMIDALQLPVRMPKVKADVVLMNPPFSSNPATGINDPDIGSKMVARALAMLAPGGRLVAIVCGGMKMHGTVQGMHMDAANYARWWQGCKSKYTVRANIGLAEKEFSKYGAAIQTRLLVIDNCGPTTEPVLSINQVESLYEAMSVLEPVWQLRNGSAQLVEPAPVTIAEIVQPAPERIIIATIPKTELVSEKAPEPVVVETPFMAAITPKPEIKPNLIAARAMLSNFSEFMPKQQVQVLEEIIRRSEGLQEMFPVMLAIKEQMQAIPKRYFYERNKKAVKMCHARYFTMGGCDWYIMEWDRAEGDFFCYAILNNDLQMSEYGYTSLSELTSSRHVELDFYWTPRPMDEVLKERFGEEDEEGEKYESVEEVLQEVEQEPAIHSITMVDDVVVATHSYRSLEPEEDAGFIAGLDPLNFTLQDVIDNRHVALAEPTTSLAAKYLNEPYDHAAGLANRHEHLLKKLELEKEEIQTARAVEEAGEEIKVEVEEVVPLEEAQGDVFIGYKPYLTLSGTRVHPAPLVESDAMRAVNPPVPKAPVLLPREAIELGALSDAQVETITLAAHAHSQLLRDGVTRKGFLIGQGTGFGKGACEAGIFWHHWKSGCKRMLWVTKESSLIKDARRDWVSLGEDANFIFALQNEKGAVTREEGILFVTYDMLARRQAAVDAGGLTETDISTDEESGMMTVKQKGVDRFKQVLDWKPEVICFDESHLMANCVSTEGKRGSKKPSLRALTGVELQVKLPDARITFASATAATEVHNLAYCANRLGLCGEGVSAFPSTDVFVQKIRSGGMLAMELVAKDMKALGLYMASNLSYNGTSFDLMVHELTDQQRQMYDHCCECWRMVLETMEEAMVVNGSDKNRDQRRDVKTQFYGGMQRFFNQILTSMQTPTAIRDMEKQLAAGNSVVVQLVNTNEAATERAVAAALGEGSSLDDLDITPRDTLINLIKSVFPIVEYEEFETEAGNKSTRPVLDEKGDMVVNPMALAMKEDLILRISTIMVPEGALDMIVNHFGPLAIAEISGRKERYVMKMTDSGMHRVKESRSKRKGGDEAEEFMDGHRRILIFSGAGNTGRSFQSDLRRMNQQRRIHYVLQAGWRADEALQGMGRTHRTNQANAPEYILVTTDLKGQKRFITSIARRIEQLGSLTKGNRKAASGGLFRPEDNLETSYAQGAIFNFFQDLENGHVDGLGFQRVCRELGLELVDPETGRVNRKAMPGITQFLNRMLCLSTDTQTLVFDAWYERMLLLIERAREEGTLDLGVEKIYAEKIVKTGEIDVHVDLETGAVTQVVELQLNHRVRKGSFEQALAGTYAAPHTYAGFAHCSSNSRLHAWKLNQSSGMVYAYFEVGSETDARSGYVSKRFRRFGPRGGGLVNEQTAGKMNEKIINEYQAKKLWDADYAQIADFETETIYLLTGAILPVWDRLAGGEAKVQSVETDEGERIIGRKIENEHFAQTMANLGASRSGSFFPAAELVDFVMNRDAQLTLANGWKVMRRRVNHEWRMELFGLDYHEGLAISSTGYVSYENIQYKSRFFVVGDLLASFEWIIRARPPVLLLLDKVETALLKSADEREQVKAFRKVRRRPSIAIDHLVERLEATNAIAVQVNEPAEEMSALPDLFSQPAQAQPAVVETVVAPQPTIVIEEEPEVVPVAAVPEIDEEVVEEETFDVLAMMMAQVAKGMVPGHKPRRRSGKPTMAGMTSLF